MVYWRAWINLSRYIQIYDGFPVVSYGFILFFCWWVEQFGDRDSRGSHGLARCRNSGACCQHHQSWACRELKLQDASTRATRWKSRCVIKQKNRTCVNSFHIFGIDDAPIFWLRISSLLNCQSVSICLYEVLYHCKLRLQNSRAMELFHHQATFDPALRGPHLCEGGGDDPDPGVAESIAWMVRMVHHDEQSLYHSNQGCCNLIFWNMMATRPNGLEIGDVNMCQQWCLCMVAATSSGEGFLATLDWRTWRATRVGDSGAKVAGNGWKKTCWLNWLPKKMNDWMDLNGCI